MTGCSFFCGSMEPILSLCAGEKEVVSWGVGREAARGWSQQEAGVGNFWVVFVHVSLLVVVGSSILVSFTHSSCDSRRGD